MQLYKNYKPDVSIVLPTYNRAKLLKRAIDSIIEQTFTNWELIIVDDGSTDNTFEIVNNYLQKYSNIRYIKQQNMKLPIALNVGLSVSNGTFITFIGSDDEFSKEHLKLRVSEFVNDSTLDFLYGGVKIIGSEFVPDKFDRSKQIHLSECVIGGTFFGRKETFVSLNGFRNLDYSEDSDFFERLNKTNYKVKKVDYPTYIYHRENTDSITNSNKF